MTMSKLSGAGSKPLSDRLFLEKEKWRRRQARMSFARKLAVLDELYESVSSLPFLDGRGDSARESLDNDAR
jgi:hypothetical protein